jgi:hypothetical protein
MDDIEEILRQNPKAAKEIAGINKTIRTLKKLRAAGLAGKGYDLLPPYGGRRAIGEALRPTARKGARVISKMSY